MGNNRLYVLMLVHVNNNILDNINLADVANQFVDRKNRRTTNIQTFISELFIKIVRLSLHLGTFHIFIFYFLSNA